MKQFFFWLGLVSLTGQAQIAFTTQGFPNSHFGWSYAVNGNDIFAGAPEYATLSNPGTAKVYHFLKDGSGIGEYQIINEPEFSVGNRFGHSVASEGNFLAVGAPQYTSDTAFGNGKVYMFLKNGNQFSLTQTLIAPDGNSGDGFGTVYFHDGELFVGAPEKGISDEGAVYRYTFDGTSWNFAQEFQFAGTDRFGYDVKFDTNCMIVTYMDSADTKHIYTFLKSNGNWNLSSSQSFGNAALHFWDAFISNEKMYILRDAEEAEQQSGSGFSILEIRNYTNDTSWELEDSFPVFNDDQIYTTLFVSEDKMLIGSGTYVLAMTRNFPLRFFSKNGESWTYSHTLYSENTYGNDDFFGSTLDGDASGVVTGGEYSPVNPVGKSYYVEFASLGVDSPSFSDFDLYPNPSSATINIHNLNGRIIRHIKVISVTGVLLSDKADPGESFDVSNLSSGMYFLQLQFEDGTTATKRFIRS
ncbi:T9SS type A sorting domain-containing protein [Flavobacterium silvaticum]|uniref:T9SS type A sorting domain-containing protein n=1 Tax=Flavobacterium silvaticum TaxID=1852020 RepID=A0A972FJL1_9FLAO|nr:T9SS type A sorting domain-containing protein [Flavobacterium silvaticum]NMH26867.1 T9SS type A sorting domain-containing protein [Flavobacterium silvaticum]